ncbi:MAG: glycosyltransferase N-terminal domain-containing protein [Planctomycetota bacterium]
MGPGTERQDAGPEPGDPGPEQGIERALPPPITSPPAVGARQRALQVLYDAAIGTLWFVLLPGFLLAGIFQRRLARKALSLSTVGLEALGPPDPARPRVLVHGVSVGEIKAAESIVAALREDYDVVVSAFSDTGLEMARQLYDGVPIVRYPFDFRPLVRRFWSRVQPDSVLLMELEAWPCFLREANRRGAPVAVVSGRITEGSFRRYKMFGSLPEFGRISLFAAQDDAYAGRFRHLARGDARVVVTGNVKPDGMRVRESSLTDAAFHDLSRDAGLGGTSPTERLVFVAGSTHEDEELRFVRAARRVDPAARLIVVPRHPERSPSVQAALAAELPEDAAPELLSEVRERGTPGDVHRPLIVDRIGVLERLYGLADVVFIGGSLVPHGGQNMMEPAAQGRPVLYGPHVDNFLVETRALEAAGAARRVADDAELERALGELARDPALRGEMGRRARAEVDGQRGATAATLRALEQRRVLPRPGLSPGPL